jgi:hypothetical protein
VRTSEEIREAIRHLRAAQVGAVRASSPNAREVASAVQAEALREENKLRAIIISRMIDVLEWTLRNPSELSEWMVAFQKIDRIEKMGFAGRIA